VIEMICALSVENDNLSPSLRCSVLFLLLFK
jgi:hypothetical protein